MNDALVQAAAVFNFVVPVLAMIIFDLILMFVAIGCFVLFMTWRESSNWGKR